MTTGKTIALTRWTFVGKVMSLLFNMLSTLAITSLPRGMCLLISWLQAPSSVILEPQKIKSATVSPLFAIERLLLNKKTPGFLASRGEEFNLGPEMRLDCSELLCNKVLLKYKEKASDIGIRRGQKEYPLASVNNEVI